MARPNFDPDTILLSSARKPVILNTDRDAIASEAATPGMLMESHRPSATLYRWRKNASATDLAQIAVLLEGRFVGQNTGVDVACAAEDLVPIALLGAGDVFWGLIPSGQTVNYDTRLQSNADGNLKVATADTADAGVARLKSLDELGAVTVTTRCRVEVIA